MATYFSNFPKINYSLDKNEVYIETTDILKRFKPLDVVIRNKFIYYDYTVKDGETPPIVADKIYKKMDYDWIILMFNQRLDPYFQWPLFYNQFNDYLEEKYGSIEASTQQIHHYEWIIQPQSILYDGTQIGERIMVVDQATYLTLAEEERRTVYSYDWEFDRNEARRNIKIIDGEYIKQILKEKETIFVNG